MNTEVETHVGAEQIQRAVCQVDIAHEAEYQGETTGYQEIQAAERVKNILLPCSGKLQRSGSHRQQRRETNLTRHLPTTLPSENFLKHCCVFATDGYFGFIFVTHDQRHTVAIPGNDLSGQIDINQMRSMHVHKSVLRKLTFQ